MFILSGCSGDAFLDAMKEEEDFIAPFDVVLSTGEEIRTTYFPIADTASSTEDDAITSIAVGDDGFYTDRPRAVNMQVFNNYTTITGDVTNHDIVKDNVTGLWWTKCSATAPNTMDTIDDCSGSKVNIDDLNNSALMEWSKAAATCKNLTYAGHKDWRLPRLPELLTIVNYGYHPAIDPSIFPNAQGSFIPDISLAGSDSNYTFIVNHYTKDRYSLDTRSRFRFNTESTVANPNPEIPPGHPDYTSAKYVKEDEEYVFNKDYTELYRIHDTGTYVFQFISVADLDNAIPNIRCNEDGGTNPLGAYFNISGLVISRGSNRYNYNSLFGYIPSDTGEFIKAYIPDNEDQFSFDGVNYSSGSGDYRRAYILDTRVKYSFDGTNYNVDIAGTYILGDYGKYFKDNTPHYKFNGIKFVVDPAGKFIQRFDSPMGYWTYSSKLQFDSNFNTADYGWIVFHQGGGTFGVNMASYKLKIKEDLSFEKQFVRCVRKKGSGEVDDADFPWAED
ncbi:MAG: hypothetical protein CVV49_20655 [Spirochaetae bacterium HGW-Spirochaetae-5]|nr:MAG: hypothetical protein CVV49_20655 [Spirochaetae bacterium HGW-Spirochaetae-5]